jgi:hypothetical protein
VSYTIRFDGTVPQSLNDYLRMNHHEKTGERKMWEQAIFVLLGRERVTTLRAMAARKQKMRVTVTICNSRQYDRDNTFGACKLIFDACKGLGLIHDDRQAFLDQQVRQEKCKRSDKATVIEIGPAEEAT